MRSDYDYDMQRFPELVMRDVEALDMAIEALQRGLENVNADSCSEKPNMSDLISRQSAIVQTSKVIWDDAVAHDVKEVLKDLPSAQPEQTKIIKEIQKWINSGNRGSADYFIVDKIEEIINKYE